MPRMLDLIQKTQRGELPPPPIAELIGFRLSSVEPGRVEDEAVVAAYDLVAVQPAFGERHQPVPAGVFQRGDLSLGGTVEHDLLAADRAWKQRMLDVAAPGGDVPGVERKRAGLVHSLESQRTDGLTSGTWTPIPIRPS